MVGTAKHPFRHREGCKECRRIRDQKEAAVRQVAEDRREAESEAAGMRLMLTPRQKGGPF